MKILVVDDEAICLALVEHALTQDGHEVSIARNGREAVEVMQKDPHRMVISDWEMPEMSGIELCQAVRQTTQTRYVYVILLTSRTSVSDVVAGLSAGADDFLSKPFEPAELLVRVRAAQRILSLETRDMTIFAMAKLAESRDTDTGEHLERVRRYVRLLAIQLRDQNQYRDIIDSEYIQMIYLTSPLHDIGKISIPDSVLLKPGRLTDEEYEVMQTHAAIGARTLSEIEEHTDAAFLRMARDIAWTHHERYDGRGYPRGLAGDRIPLCGRITAVADVYDALRSKRVYKDAYSHETACDIISEGRGTQFDPAIVDAFLAISDQFDEINRKLANGQEADHPVPCPA